MKTAKLILAAAFAGIAGIASLAATANALQTAQVRTNPAAQVVTITAKRMTEAEKRAFDLQSSGYQTVVISAKRLSPEQKAAIDRQDREWQAAAQK